MGMERCFVCKRALPNEWSVGRRETVDGEVRVYCQLHAAAFRPKSPPPPPSPKGNERSETIENERNPETMSDKEERTPQKENAAEKTAREEAIAKRATGERVKKAWAECAALAGKLGGGIKALWAKIHPDRSPQATLQSLDGDLKVNRERFATIKPELDAVYRQIVAKKKEYQNAPPARQRLLKVELQTLLTRYKGLEREFNILAENERSIEAVRARYLEVLAYGKRGKVDEDMVDRLADDVDDAAEDAEGLQDALADLERAGRRRERDTGDFDATLADFDGELGLADIGAEEPAAGDLEQETQNGEHNETDSTVEPRLGDGDFT